MVSREQELIDLLEAHKALVKRAAGADADRAELNLTSDPTYANIYMQLAAERRRILDEQREQSRLEREERAYRIKEEWYNNKIKSLSDEQKELRQKHIDSISSECEDKLHEISQFDKEQREYIYQFFEASDKELELLSQRGYEFSWGINKSSGVYSCRLHEDVTSHSLGVIIIHLHQEPVQHKAMCHENLEAECEDNRNKALQEQNDQLAQLKRDEIERFHIEERKQIINAKRKEEQELSKKFGLAEPEKKLKNVQGRL